MTKRESPDWVDLRGRLVFREAAAVSLMVWLVVTALSLPVMAQVDTVSTIRGITVETAVDRADMFIGDLINYKLTITYDSTYELVPPPLGANLGAFDVKDYQTDQISRLDDGRMRSESNFVLSTFTTGDYVIPPIPALFNLPDGSRKVILSEAVPIVVNSLLGAESDSADIRPLKPPKPPTVFARDPREKGIIGGAATVVLIVIAWYLWRRFRRKPDRAAFVDRRQPWEIAFERLALLSEKSLMAQSKHKLYYIELTEIVREYFGRMYEVDVLEMTTDEFLVRFIDVALPNDLYDNLRNFLSHADLVKFARFVPQEERAGTDFNLAHDMVESVRLEFERRLQVEMAVASNDKEKPTEGPTEVEE
ncbi:MAG: hypothetical protein OEV49_04020 [candidate division Zixibacteria bacterium]|nr:hypothetical protein [candidate division Zixibacteria bacterium]MDH3937879.1 hypothetical protein [candidate division Zixibacteria bacterium]MDH4034686.1 hypothetical protein [candidate division Zixibacteria bacterium]